MTEDQWPIELQLQDPMEGELSTQSDYQSATNSFHESNNSSFQTMNFRDTTTPDALSANQTLQPSLDERDMNLVELLTAQQQPDSVSCKVTLSHPP